MSVNISNEGGLVQQSISSMARIVSEAESASDSEIAGAEASSSRDASRLDLLEERINSLDKKAVDIKALLDLSEKRQQGAISFVMWIASVIVIGFFLASIPFFFDYYRDSASRYENFTRRIDNLDLRLNNLENKEK